MDNKETTKTTSLEILGIGALTTGLAQIQGGDESLVTGIVMTVVGIIVLALINKKFF
jgi:hypothetical protein